MRARGARTKIKWGSIINQSWVDGMGVNRLIMTRLQRNGPAFLLIEMKERGNLARPPQTIGRKERVATRGLLPQDIIGESSGLNPLFFSSQRSKVPLNL